MDGGLDQCWLGESTRSIIGEVAYRQYRATDPVTHRPHFTHQRIGLQDDIWFQLSFFEFSLDQCPAALGLAWQNQRQLGNTLERDWCPVSRNRLTRDNKQSLLV